MEIKGTSPITSDSIVDAAQYFDAAVHQITPYHTSVFWGDRMLTLDKSAAFRADPRFKAAISSANSDTGANQYSSPDGIAWRFNTLIWAASQALLVDGDFVECGVYEGDMSWVITEMVDLEHANRRLYLYDTFAGFSPKYSSPADFPDAPEFFEFANSHYQRPGLHESVVRRFAPKPYVSVVRGIVPDILCTTAPTQIAFLHLDMNSPEPERAALEFLFDRVSAGGVMIFDDYGWSMFRRQREAADEFMKRHSHVILELPTGRNQTIVTGVRATSR
jgi:hypothetical protein